MNDEEKPFINTRSPYVLFNVGYYLNEQLKQKLENLGLNENNDMVKMIDGKVFIKM